MLIILKTTLGKARKVKADINSHIARIFVDETEVTEAKVLKYFGTYRLATKQPELLDGRNAL